ncbi:hypothetical protein M758_1G128600 [Ceratodon purpureus]|nr:hypothetical protein M758_1G128600 [Ceratodon purpureus]
MPKMSEKSNHKTPIILNSRRTATLHFKSGSESGIKIMQKTLQQSVVCGGKHRQSKSKVLELSHTATQPKRRKCSEDKTTFTVVRTALDGGGHSGVDRTYLHTRYK